MKIVRLNSFKRDYKKLPPQIQEKLDRQLGVLIENPSYPSLRIKKIEEYHNCWEGRISQEYRFTFSWIRDALILRRAGSHDVLKNP